MVCVSTETHFTVYMDASQEIQLCARLENIMAINALGNVSLKHVNEECRVHGVCSLFLIPTEMGRIKK